jgi:sporulation protein YlmC with PRC-barrel domain
MKRRQERVLNVESHLRGMPVITADGGERLGDVTDAVVHPTHGRLLGVVIRTPEREDRIVPEALFTIGVDAIMVQGEIRGERADVRDEIRSGTLASKGLVGTNVVTEDGTLLGRVSEVFVSASEPRTALRVVESSIQQFFGGGFYMRGDVPSSYAPDGTRMIVPSDTREHRAAESADEALHKRAEEAGSPS